MTKFLKQIAVYQTHVNWSTYSLYLLWVYCVAGSDAGDPREFLEAFTPKMFLHSIGVLAYSNPTFHANKMRCILQVNRIC